MPQSSDDSSQKGYAEVPVRREEQEPVPRADHTTPDDNPPRDAAGNVTKPGAKPRDEGGREGNEGG